jgi:Rad3-related DNA helicase
MSIKSDLNKYTPRKEQNEALDFISDVIKNQPDKKFILLDLPTGVGKSLLALMIMNWYQENINEKGKFDILTDTKILQEQLTNEFSCLNSLWGRDNYRCKEYGTSCAQGKEFNRLLKNKGKKCEWCPYDDARTQFISGDYSLTNFYLYILYALYMPDIIKTRGSDILIVDESHNFDTIFSDFISISITETMIRKYQFDDEYNITMRLSQVETLTDYIDYLNYLRPRIAGNITKFSNQLGLSDSSVVKVDTKINGMFNTKSDESKLVQMMGELEQLLTKVDTFLVDYKEAPENWVMENKWNEKTKTKDFSIEPIWAHKYLDKYVWSKYKYVIFMSGTILNRNMFSELNGLDSEKSVYHYIPSPFPKENRPIYYFPITKMTFKNKEAGFKKMIPYIEKTLSKYKDKKGIIHTVSFEFANWIKENIKSDRFLFHDSSNKDEVLRKHQTSPHPTILVSPSMETGVSLDDDLSRFQIIMKMPYPSLSSIKNKTRLKLNPKWYSWRTISTLLQMSGRSVRSVDDSADTIIFDSCFSDILSQDSTIFPKYWIDAIKFVNVK